MADFTGKRVLVTGAGRGIGRATAQAFHEAGASVALNDIGAGRLGAAVAALGGGARLLPLAGDVSSAVGCRAVVEGAVAALGGLDVLVNSAGLFRSGPVESFDEAEYDRMFAVNVKGPHFCSLVALPALRRSQGAIVTLASEAGLIGSADCAVYCATKGAVVNWTRALALEVAPEVRVNCVCPGAIDSDMLWENARGKPDAEGFGDRVRQHYALKRIGTVEEVAAAILYLASDAAGFVTGTALAIDGGASAGH
jgi:NAD(P)-dependent dehydrogenase (short-subunit alcohol dehydrogenase family)